MLLIIDTWDHVYCFCLDQVDEIAFAHNLEVDFNGHVSLSIVSANRCFGGEW